MTTFALTGGCLCGNIRYSLLAPAKQVEHCHCSMCRKTYGALYASLTLVDREALRMMRDKRVCVRTRDGRPFIDNFVGTVVARSSWSWMRSTMSLISFPQRWMVAHTLGIRQTKRVITG
jgi:hypothetical protein